MPSITTTTATHSSGGAYTQSLREKAKEEMGSENWNKYSALALLNAVKSMSLKGHAEEAEGDLADAYVTYFKASL